MNGRSEYLLKKNLSAADFNRGPLQEAPRQSETTQHVSRGGSFPRKEPSRLLPQDRAGAPAARHGRLDGLYSTIGRL
jgi:hypothetical protein